MNNCNEVKFGEPAMYILNQNGAEKLFFIFYLSVLLHGFI